MTLTLTDLFCGAGGSSSGAIQVPGVEVKMAANHWRLAVETHNTNHPGADHDCADISKTDPHRYPSTDLLWASPECINHSQAKPHPKEDETPKPKTAKARQALLFGELLPDEAAERSRATMSDVPKFVEAMILRGRPYKGFVVENVVEVRKWEFFDAWGRSLRSAGYCLHFVYMNSMHAQAGGLPAPQSRDRFYCVGHLQKIPCPDLDRWTSPEAFCASCDRMVAAVKSWKKPESPWGKYRQQYLWRCPGGNCGQVVEPGWLPAASAIDWSLRGQRIGDRDEPLAPNTMARIEAGLRKFATPTPYLVRHYTPRGNLAQMSTPVTGPVPTLTASFIPWLINPSPMLVPVEGRDGVNARSIAAPARTQTSRAETAFVVPLRAHNTPKEAARTFDTFAAAGNHHALVMRNNGDGESGWQSTHPNDVLRTLTSAGHQSIVAWEHMLYDYNGPARSPGQPLATSTTVEGEALASLAIDVNDCEFRMLEPFEVKRGMAFAPSYVLLGNRREQVRQAGNAVTPPCARDLIASLVEVITGEPFELVA